MPLCSVVFVYFSKYSERKKVLHRLKCIATEEQKHRKKSSELMMLGVVTKSSSIPPNLPGQGSYIEWLQLKIQV
jgi:hypothetical protein